MRTLAVLLLMSAVAAAQTKPVPKIKGPTKARTGDIIILDASESTADHFHWLIDDSSVTVPEGSMQSAQKMADQLRQLGFKVEPPKDAKTSNYLMIDGGKKLILASYPGTWKIILAVGNKGGVDQLAWTLVVQGAKPTPNPGPGPTPPAPTPPTGKVARAMYDAAMASRSPMKVADAKSIAGKLRALRPEIAGATSVTKEVIATKIIFAIKDGAGSNWKHWGGADGPLGKHLMKPLGEAITDKDAGLSAIDELIIGCESVK